MWAATILYPSSKHTALVKNSHQYALEKTSPDGKKYVGESKDYRYSDRKKYKELDEKKYPGINERQRRMERAINKDDKEALYRALFPGDLPIESYGY